MSTGSAFAFAARRPRAPATSRAAPEARRDAGGGAPSAPAPRLPSASACASADAAAAYAAGGRCRPRRGPGMVGGQADRSNASSSAAAKPRLEAIAKATDPALTAGTADVSALVKEVGADTCFATRRALATALFDGGSSRYAAKSYEEATRYWRALRSSSVPRSWSRATTSRAGSRSRASASTRSRRSPSSHARPPQVRPTLRSRSRRRRPTRISRASASDACVPDGARGSLGREPRRAAQGAGYRREGRRCSCPTTSARVKDKVGATPTGGGIITYKPAVTDFWTWHPDASTELLVATIIDDPAKRGVPKPDLHMDYGAIGIFKRDAAGKLTLLTVRKTGYTLPDARRGEERHAPLLVRAGVRRALRRRSRGTARRSACTRRTAASSAITPRAGG